MIYILNGPNLNLLGRRDNAKYGSFSLSELEKACFQKATTLNISLIFRQTNHEGILIDWIDEVNEKAQSLILNAAAFTHTSIALYDALQVLTIPIIEVHLSVPSKYEPFRSTSYVTPFASGVISGFGIQSYLLALEAIALLAHS